MRRARALAAVIVVVATLSHLRYWFASNHVLYDSPQYVANARSLAEGRGFLDESGQPEVRRTPGYPLFLLLFAPADFSYRAVAATQHVLAIVLAVIVFFAARRFLESDAAAFAAALLVATDIGQIVLADYVMTETLASVVLFAIVPASVAAVRVRDTRRWWYLAAAGLLTGAAALVRPVASYLLVPLAVWVFAFTTERRLRATTLFVLAAMLLPGAWIARNIARSGLAHLSSIGAETIYAWRGAGVIAMKRSGFQYSPLPFSGEEEFRYQFFRVVQHEVSDALREEELRRFGRPATAAERAALQSEFGRRILLAHPVETVLLTIYGALHLAFDTMWIFPSAVYAGDARRVMIAVMFAMAVVSVPLAALGIRALWRGGRRDAAALLATILLYFVAVSSGPEHEQWRYRVPLMPVYAIAIAAGAFALVSRPARLPAADRRSH